LKKYRGHLEEGLEKSTEELRKADQQPQQDITERKHAEEMLRNSEISYRRLFETAQDGILLLDADTGQITDVNPYLIEMLGYSHNEFLGKKLWEIGLFKHIAENQAGFQKLQSEKYIRYENLPLETRGGQRIDVEFVSNAYSVDHKTVIQCNIRDITERRRAEEKLWKYCEHLEELVKERTTELRIANENLQQEITERKHVERVVQEAREYAESIVETVREPLAVLDTDLRVISVNHSFYQTFKVTPENIEGKLIYDLTNLQWNIPKLRVLLEEIIPRDNQFQNFEVEHEFPTIGRKIMLLNARQIYSKEISKRMILLAIEDITERKLAEIEIRKLNEELKQNITQLEAANKELEVFSYSISHDLRAPLRSLDGFSQVLFEDYANQLDEQGKDYLQRIRKASQHMAELIDALLMLSRMTRKEIHYETVDLSTLAQAILAELRQTQPKRQIEVVIEEGLVVKGDPQLLRVVIENLLANAWKYTSRKPEVRIEVGALRQEDGKRTYFVRDNGAGFDMAFADKLFKAFQRLHTPNEFPGVGIGLATVQRIIHRHGGRVWAEGEVEKGATFFFTLSNKR